MLASLGDVQAALDEHVNVTGEQLVFGMTLLHIAVGLEFHCS